MTETQAEYKTKTTQQTPWRCKGCGKELGYIRECQLNVVTDDKRIIFIRMSGDALVGCECGAVQMWHHPRKIDTDAKSADMRIIMRAADLINAGEDPKVAVRWAEREVLGYCID